MAELSRILKALEKESPAMGPVPSNAKGIVTGVTSDSRDAGPGRIFVAIDGTKVDGHSFLPEVAKKGTTLMIGEKPASEVGLPAGAPYLQVEDARLALGILASEVVGNPSREMLVIGITGTSGKTTTTYLVESILRAAGKRVGLIGTVSFRIDGKDEPSTHTTPGPVELQQLLRRMRDAGCDALIMEVSSHALKQRRAAGVAFDAAAFTNLSSEHLDYHPGLDDYFESKALLFSSVAERSRRWGKNPKFAIHATKPWGIRMLDLIASRGSGEAIAFEVPADTVVDAGGIRGIFSGIAIESPLIGKFNAENVATAVAVTKAAGIPESAIARGIAAVGRVPGRLDQVPDPKGGRVVLVDYAHKPDALEKVLEILRPMRGPKGRLFCVFGCGGDRDRVKRPVMGEIATRLADRVILTSDNPRTENPDAILDEIEKGCEGRKNYDRVPDRKRAIERAIADSHRGDIILIAGKGHEDYQIVGTEKTHFDDREVAANALG
jgi:UDP-N-acetylmuramoyl-L-alanyl-D-glutamate--2,6-diaminopimelate ligase